MKNKVTSKFEFSGGRIRELDATSSQEIDLVAKRMRETLVEVVGEAEGLSMYSMEWLCERVLWHLNSEKTVAKVFVAEGVGGQIVGHAIARVETGECGESYGYFSTIFVEPESRTLGVATSLMFRIESWFLEKKMRKIIYNTATDNTRLRKLFSKYGYQVTAGKANMVQLTKRLPLE